MEMDDERYRDLMVGDAAMLTKKEINEGWHWCPEMDQLLCVQYGEDCLCNEYQPGKYTISP